MAKITLVGDAMLDVYHHSVNRSNPESSAPCYTVERTEYKPGGAANVAVNLKSLGADFDFVSVVGDDYHAGILRKALDDLKVGSRLIADSRRRTIVKERIISSKDGRYHFRLDFEKKEYINDSHVSEISDLVLGSQPELILVSDYDKGIVSYSLMERLKGIGVPVIVDPKSAHKNFYKGVFMIKPNSREVREMTGLDEDMAAADKLMHELGARVLLTRGESGISYFGLAGEDKRFDVPAHKVQFFDGTGAGDVILATFAHFFAKKLPIQECVRLANKAAGISVQFPGCYAVSEKEILE